jgi:hypothetical protein
VTPGQRTRPRAPRCASSRLCPPARQTSGWRTTAHRARKNYSAWQTMLLVTGPHTQDLRFPLRLQLARLVLPDPSAQQVPM